MNNEEFDNMIRQSVGNNSVAPSDQTGRSLGRKMRYKNIWFFHKTKAFLTLLLLGVVSIPLWNSLNLEQNSNYQKLAHNSNGKEKSLYKKSDKKNQLILKDKTEKITLEKNHQIDKFNELSNIEKNETLKKENTSTKSETSEKQSKLNNSSKVNLIKNRGLTKNIKLNNSNRNLEVTRSIASSKDELLLTKKHKTQDNNQSIVKIQPIKALLLNPQIENSIVDFTFDSQKQNVDYVKYKGTFSIDAYITPFNQLNIENELNKSELSQEYELKEWDFYTNEGIVNSGFSGGIRANYNWKNIIASGGVKIATLRDYKPMYKYESVKDEEVLEYFSLTEISGVQIQDKDSAHFVFHSENNPELINRLEKDAYNTYKYLSIPLRIGYEFKQDKYSIAVQGGGIYNHLLKAKGSYLKKYNNTEDLDIYYNRGIETVLLENENSMLKKGYFSFIGALITNVRLSESFDVFGEINYTKSFKNITKQNYFINKKAQTVSANFGVRYYLKPKTKLS